MLKNERSCVKKTLTTSADIVKPVNITRVLLTTSLNKHPSSDHKYSPVQSTHRHRGPGSHRVPPFPRDQGSVAVCVVILTNPNITSHNGENTSLNIVLNIEKTVIRRVYRAM